MVQIAEWAVVNALTVVVLAPLVWGLARVVPWPAARHGLWLVLLLKLVTPPLVPVPTSLPSEWQQAESPACFFDKTSQLDQTLVTVRTPPSPNETLAMFSDSGNEVLTSNSSLATTAPGTPAATAAEPVLAGLESLPVTAKLKVAASGWSWEPWAASGVLLWVVGSLVFFVVQTSRLVIFARRLRRFTQPCPTLDDEMAAAAKRCGLPPSSVPAACLVDGAVSPMLWGVGPWTRVLFPADLFTQLDSASRGTLLLHELAHFRRRDHWVRMLEFVTAGLYWWHPVVWWAFRELESAEEDCCDSWVLERSTTSPRCYAEALLDTIDFLCEQHRAAQPMASGLGNPTEIRGRLIRIMSGAALAPLSPMARCMAWSLAVVLPLEPALFAGWAGSLRTISWTPTVRSDRDFASESSAHISLSPGETLAAVTSIASPRFDRNFTPVITGRSSAAMEWARATSPNGRFQIVARSAHAAPRVELLDLEKSTAADLSPRSVACVAFVPGTTLFVSGGVDRQVRLWDAAAANPVCTLGEHSDAVVSVVVAADGRTVFTASRDGLLSRWSLTDRSLRDDVLFDMPITCLRANASGDQLAVATGSWRTADGGSVRWLDARTLSVMQTASLPAPIGAVGWLEDGTLAAGDYRGTVYYLGDDGAVQFSLFASKDAVSAAAFSSDTGAFPQRSRNAARAEIERERIAVQAAEAVPTIPTTRVAPLWFMPAQ